LAWQDTWFSLSFDRPSTIAIGQPPIPYQPTSQPGGRTYFETTCRLISLTLEIVRERMFGGSLKVKPSTIVEYMERIRQILGDTQLYLRFPDCCFTLSHRLQKAFLGMHASYISAELSRSTLHINIAGAQPQLLALQKECIAYLVKTVEAYIEIHLIDARASRTWIAFQRSISCAFLLAVAERSKSDPMVMMILQKLEAILVEHAAADGLSESPQSDSSRPAMVLNRTLSTLRKLIAFLSRNFAITRSQRLDRDQDRTASISNPVTSPTLESPPGLSSARLPDDDLSARVAQYIQPSLWSWDFGDFEPVF